MLRRLGSLLLCFVLAVGGCTAPSGVATGQKKLLVVTTIFPLADLVKNIGGDAVAVSYLLPQGASPHTYEPTVDQIRELSGARLFVLIGGGLDDWAAGLTEAAGEELSVITLSRQVELPQEPHRHGGEDETREADAEETVSGHHGDAPPDNNHAHEFMDPHIWLDPILVRDQICPLLASALSELAPQHEEHFQRNLSCFQDELTALDAEIWETTASFRQRRFISFHSAWFYFARRYGLEEAASIAAFPGQEPSARWLADLVTLAGRYDLKVIFAEPQLNKAIAQRIAEEIGGEVLILDPLGGANLAGRETYLNLMRYNLNVFKAAMQ